MKLCFACGVDFKSEATVCPSCSVEPARIDGYHAFSPELAHQNDGFKIESFSILESSEAESFWFRARNEIIIFLMRTYCKSISSFLEIGCGTGFVLSGVSNAFPNLDITGSEIYVNGLDIAAQRVPGAKFFQMDARAIPFRDEFDAIGAFDVLEHIEEDVKVLSEIRKALNPGGYLLLSVPQHAWLWSATDDYACHVRRYTKNDLHAKLKKAGFTVLRSTSFVSLLLPLMYLSRIRQKKAMTESSSTGELAPPKFVNAVLYSIMKIELKAIQLGLNFPLGGSRVIVAQKNPENEVHA